MKSIDNQGIEFISSIMSNHDIQELYHSRPSMSSGLSSIIPEIAANCLLTSGDVDKNSKSAVSAHIDQNSQPVQFD